MGAFDIFHTGEEHEEHSYEELSEDRQVKDAKEGRRTLALLGDSALVEYIQRRWKRLDKASRLLLALVKVNWLRYDGQSFVQVHPSDPNRIWSPPGPENKVRRAPTINRIERAVDRYVAQVTADEPVLEGVPPSHRQQDRDAAEAATFALRSEFQRMKLDAELQRGLTISAVMKSFFWFFQWDTNSGETQPAMKFFPTEIGSKVLLPVGPDGKKVDDISKAAQIRSGNISVKTLNPANVRWVGSRYAHDATELMVSEVLSLRDILEVFPAARKAKVNVLLNEKERPVEAMAWMADAKAGSFGRGDPRSQELDDSYEQTVAGELEDGSSVLDEPVMVTHFFRKRSRDYPKGFYAIVVGAYRVHKGSLRYGIMPVAHFKFLDDIMEPMGRSLVDLLKDPQELLDFVNGQILRYLQMLKRRWFVPQHSNVKARDLLSPTRSIIEYNPAGGAPTPEVQPEIPNSMISFVERFDEDFNDQMGIHDTLQGKHVPGVSSGRHAEALRSGDETLLGLTRKQTVIGLEHSGKVILSMIKREWKQERRVRFLGEDRAYVDMAFKATDFGDTTNVHLRPSTMLMLTPAQRLETLFAWNETGLLQPNELRAMAPIGDIAGVSLMESAHYQRARRQNTRFLQGPPKKLVSAYDEYKDTLESLDLDKDYIERGAGLGMAAEHAQVAMQRIEGAMAAAEMKWRAERDKYTWDHRPWEDNMNISRIHADLHAEALASDKVDLFPEWWVEIFEQHATNEWRIGYPEQQPQQPSPEEAAGGTPAATDIPTEPAGLNFEENMPGPVQGQAP